MIIDCGGNIINIGDVVWVKMYRDIAFTKKATVIGETSIGMIEVSMMDRGNHIKYPFNLKSLSPEEYVLWKMEQ